MYRMRGWQLNFMQESDILYLLGYIYLGKYIILGPTATDSTGRLVMPTIFSAILNTSAAIVNVELIPTEVGTMPPSAI